MIPCRPSSSHIWRNCHGYPRLVAALPRGWETTSSDPAREGTCAAWVAEMVLQGHYKSTDVMVGEMHANGWVVDQDMANFVQGYLDLLHERYGDMVVVEERVKLSEFIAGTPDAFAVIDDHLYVDDLKYGHSIVEPWENPQIMIYAGAIAKASPVQINHVTIGVYQPRVSHPLGHHRTWSPSLEELSDHLVQLVEASREAQREDAMCIAGEHCRHCDAAHRCSAVAFENYRAVSFMRNDQQRELTNEEMSAELAFIELAEAILSGRKTAIKADAKARIASGQLIEGWLLERGVGQRRWTCDAETVKLMTGIDPMSDKMVTPAELERRGANKDLVGTMTNQPKTAPQLKRFNARVAGADFKGFNK